MELFNQSSEKDNFQKIKLKDGELWFLQQFIPLPTSDAYFEKLKNHINWKQEKIKIFGKIHPIPRLTAWYGNEDLTYKYSGISSSPEPWTLELLEIKQYIETLIGFHKFNSVLLNYYRHGNDKVSWHSDNEKELGENPLIASVSLGTTRRFDLKHKSDSQKKISMNLPSGSLIIMKGSMQHNWLHQIPAQKKVAGSRINLTYRTIISQI